jgi:hypothetical protein
MDFTTDKLRSMVRKWQTLIEAHVDVKTTDGYTLRMFCLGFTKKRQGQVKRTAYAQSSQVRGRAGRVEGEHGGWRDNMETATTGRPSCSSTRGGRSGREGMGSKQQLGS